MRSKFLGFVLGCALVALPLSALACPYTSASSDQTMPQQTAQAQSATQPDSQQ